MLTVRTNDWMHIHAYDSTQNNDTKHNSFLINKGFPYPTIPPNYQWYIAIVE